MIIKKPLQFAEVIDKQKDIEKVNDFELGSETSCGDGVQEIDEVK